MGEAGVFATYLAVWFLLALVIAAIHWLARRMAGW